MENTASKSFAEKVRDIRIKSLDDQFAVIADSNGVRLGEFSRALAVQMMPGRSLAKNEYLWLSATSLLTGIIAEYAAMGNVYEFAHEGIGGVLGLVGLNALVMRRYIRGIAEYINHYKAWEPDIRDNLFQFLDLNDDTWLDIHEYLQSSLTESGFVLGTEPPEGYYFG